MCQRCVERAQDEQSLIVRALRKLLGAAGRRTYLEQNLNEPTRNMLGNAYMLAEVALQATTQEPFGDVELQQLRSGVMSLLMTQERVGVHDRQRSIQWVESLLDLVRREPEFPRGGGRSLADLVREFFGEGASVSSPFQDVTMVEMNLADLFRPREPSAQGGNTSRSDTMQDERGTQGGGLGNQYGGGQPFGYPQNLGGDPFSQQYGGYGQPRHEGDVVPVDRNPEPPQRQPDHPYPEGGDQPATGVEEPADTAVEQPVPDSEVRPDQGGIYQSSDADGEG